MLIQIYSFFSGAGFLDLGFQNAGFNIAFVNEYDNRFLQAYKYARRNDEHIPIYGYSDRSIRDYLSDEVWNRTFPDYHRRNDLLIGFIGGPPCPDFSVAGKNKGEFGVHGQLTSVYTSIIVHRQPDFFVLENVKGLCQTQKHKEFYERIKQRLYKAGYSLFDSIENSLEYGVPQNRDRLILIGFLRRRFGKRLNYSFGEHRLYNKQDIKNLNWPSPVPFKENSVTSPPNGIIEKLTVQHWFAKNNVHNHPNGNDYFNVIEHDKFQNIREGDTSRKSFKRLHRWKYSPTAAYGNNEVHLHPYLPRRISVAEALAIQSLPAEFELPNNLSLSAKFKMVGNGVPYLLSLGVATELNEWIHNHLPEVGE